MDECVGAKTLLDPVRDQIQVSRSKDSLTFWFAKRPLQFHCISLHLTAILSHKNSQHNMAALSYFVSPRREVLLRYNPAIACVVDVRGLYQHLASRAIAAGAVLRLRHVVEQAITGNGRVLGVTARNHTGERITLAASVTIDASGFSRHVGVRTDMGKAFHRYGYGAEYVLYAPNYPQDELYLIMGSKFAPRGYAW